MCYQTQHVDNFLDRTTLFYSLWNATSLADVGVCGCVDDTTGYYRYFLADEEEEGGARCAYWMRQWLMWVVGISVAVAIPFALICCVVIKVRLCK